MKMMKKFAVVLLALLIALSACGCLHEKDEVAVTVGDVEFTSAYYLCSFLFADLTAQQKVSEALAEKEKDTSDIDYRTQKVEGKEYQKWVKEEALKTVKNNAAYRILCDKNKVELEEDVKKEITTQLENMWASYSTWFEENGVYRTTLEKYLTDTYYQSAYFEYLYGKEGTKAPTADEVTAKMVDNLVLADMLQASFTTYDQTTYEQKKLSDAEITELKNKFNTYVSELNSGKKTFEQVYHEYNKSEQSTDTEITDFGESDVAPQNRHASILGSKEAENYTSEHFDTAKAMAVGEAKVVELEESAGLVLIVKRDIIADKYYADNYDLVVRYLLKQDEFDKTIEDYVKTLKVTVDDSAVDRFEATDITEMPQMYY
ncbi:MAG: hypothetical protein E7562_02575 [Ruminococcaceae bacterium]|nr:hypothetical protein [Oscillospiraceae bacterium]